MTRQLRKKVICYNFTINRVSDLLGLLKVSYYLLGYSDLFAIGLETKANIGSDHLQGFIKLKPGIKYFEFRQEFKIFLKENFLSACLYMTPVPDEGDTERCISYACKEKNYLVKRGDSTYFSEDLTKSARKIIMLLDK